MNWHSYRLFGVECRMLSSSSIFNIIIHLFFYFIAFHLIPLDWETAAIRKNWAVAFCWCWKNKRTKGATSLEIGWLRTMCVYWLVRAVYDSIWSKHSDRANRELEKSLRICFSVICICGEFCYKLHWFTMP